jgi:hypothetical protein
MIIDSPRKRASGDTEHGPCMGKRHLEEAEAAVAQGPHDGTRQRELIEGLRQGEHDPTCARTPSANFSRCLS